MSRGYIPRTKFQDETLSRVAFCIDLLVVVNLFALFDHPQALFNADQSELNIGKKYLHVLPDTFLYKVCNICSIIDATIFLLLFLRKLWAGCLALCWKRFLVLFLELGMCFGFPSTLTLAALLPPSSPFFEKIILSEIGFGIHQRGPPSSCRSRCHTEGCNNVVIIHIYLKGDQCEGLEETRERHEPVLLAVVVHLGKYDINCRRGQSAFRLHESSITAKLAELHRAHLCGTIPACGSMPIAKAAEIGEDLPQARAIQVFPRNG
mmetsp:Transcript_21479/g.51253  ORF Transcript_21479/g.51253 Transcript_21479/m.51253 type:complete len:264 (+) Transcript_21479:76-867(+)